MTSSIQPQAGFDYFLVLDFEATCEDNKKLEPQVRWICKLFPRSLYFEFIPEDIILSACGIGKMRAV